VSVPICYGLVTYLQEHRIAEHGEGKVRAVKLVYKVAETDEVHFSQGETVQGRDLGSNW
jgi:regulator of RNase E activity RraB